MLPAGACPQLRVVVGTVRKAHEHTTEETKRYALAVNAGRLFIVAEETVVPHTCGPGENLHRSKTECVSTSSPSHTNQKLLLYHLCALRIIDVGLSSFTVTANQESSVRLLRHAQVIDSIVARQLPLKGDRQG